MGLLLAGDGGAVLAAAATGEPPAALVCEDLAASARTPAGVLAVPPAAIEQLEGIERVEMVAGEERTRERIAGWAGERGLMVGDRPVEVLPSPRGVRVVAVSSATTGSGKTALSRRVIRLLGRLGTAVAVARHPFGNLLLWPGRDEVRVVRSPAEVAQPRPVEEQEELAPLIGLGVPVVTGIDPAAILTAAARAVGPGGVVLWDGGGSAAPWVRPDVHLVVVDLLRPPPAALEARVRVADALILTKADTAPAEQARRREGLVRSWNPDVPVLLADMPPSVREGRELARRRVVVVEDGPSLLLGGLKAGSGAVLARRFHCGVVDPRPFAVGAVARALAEHPHIGPVIPSVGRTPGERDDLRRSVAATPGDAVLWASPAPPESLIPDEPRPVIRTYAELMEVAGTPLADIVGPRLGL